MQSSDTTDRWASHEGETMTTTETRNAELVRDVTEELNAGNVDALTEYLVDGYGEGEDKPTADELIRAEKARHEAFPDWTEEIMSLTTDGKEVTAIYDVTATHEGSADYEDTYRYRSIVYTMPPTGEEMMFALIRRFEIEDGQITLWESMQTPLTMLVKLGLDWERFVEDLPEYLE